MAIQNRRGYEADFDPAKMLPGEWAVSLDTKYIRMCFAPGECLRMASYEAFEQDMEQIQTILTECQNIQDAIEQIQQTITDSVLVVERYVTSAKTYSETAASEADRATTEADRAKAEADRASSVSDIGIATTEKAGLVKPDGATITVGPDGTISATAQGGASSWNDLSDKPFDTVGNGLSVSGDTLTVDFTKVQQTESGKGLSTNDYTDTDVDKLAGIEENANNYSLPVADSDTLGGIKPDGITINVDENGIASAVGGGSVDVLDTYEEIMANTASGKVAGSKGVKEGFAELNNNLKFEDITSQCVFQSNVIPNQTKVLVNELFLMVMLSFKMTASVSGNTNHFIMTIPEEYVPNYDALTFGVATIETSPKTLRAVFFGSQETNNVYGKGDIIVSGGSDWLNCSGTLVIPRI